MSDWSRPWTRWRALRGFDHFAPRHARKNRAALADWKVPTLVVWGEDDRVFPLSHGQRFAATIPAAELVTIPNCGHWSPIDAPQVVGPAIAGFLDRVRRPGA
jgi:pimeloyl-ACP methyl ester carboxylesterase